MNAQPGENGKFLLEGLANWQWSVVRGAWCVVRGVLGMMGLRRLQPGPMGVSTWNSIRRRVILAVDFLKYEQMP
jgi:hypothetical protein